MLTLQLDTYNLNAWERLLTEDALHKAGTILEASMLLGITRHGMKRRILKHDIEWPPRGPLEGRTKPRDPRNLVVDFNICDHTIRLALGEVEHVLTEICEDVAPRVALWHIATLRAYASDPTLGKLFDEASPSLGMCVDVLSLFTAGDLESIRGLLADGSIH